MSPRKERSKMVNNKRRGRGGPHKRNDRKGKLNDNGGAKIIRLGNSKRQVKGFKQDGNTSPRKVTGNQGRNFRKKRPPPVKLYHQQQHPFQIPPPRKEYQPSPGVYLSPQPFIDYHQPQFQQPRQIPQQQRRHKPSHYHSYNRINIF